MNGSNSLNSKRESVVAEALQAYPLGSAVEAIWQLLASVPDPEVPVLSVLDLGIVRDVKVRSGPMIAEGTDQIVEVEVIITPTYTGCPAMDMIAMNIKLALVERGYQHIKITSVLSPAWTTDWMTEAGKQKLKAYGISPPNPLRSVCDTGPFGKEEVVECPQCGSYHTKLISQFGSTACKALYQCIDCREPFDYFKCH